MPAYGRWYGSRAYYSDRAVALVERAFRRLARETYGPGGEYTVDIDAHGEVTVRGTTPGGRDIWGHDMAGFEGARIDAAAARGIAQVLLADAEKNAEEVLLT